MTPFLDRDPAATPSGLLPRRHAPSIGGQRAGNGRLPQLCLLSLVISAATGTSPVAIAGDSPATDAANESSDAAAALKVSRNKEADKVSTLDAVSVKADAKDLNSQISTKRDQSVTVDSLDNQSIQVHAQDDSIASRLMTAPGVSVTRDEDTPRYITVRGIDSSLNSTTLDGITLASVGDEGSGSRSINLQLIPSEIADRIDIYKTFSAEQNPDGIGAQINLVSGSAFDHPKNSLHLDSNVNYHDLRGDNGYNSQSGIESPWGKGLSAKYSTVFGPADDFGITVSGHEQEFNGNQNKLFQTTQYFYDGSGNYISSPSAANGWNGKASPYNIAYYMDNRRTKTYGGSAKLEWWPAKGPFKASLMAYDYGMDERRTENGYQIYTEQGVTGQTDTSGTEQVKSLNAIYGNKNWSRNNRGVLGNVSWVEDDNRLNLAAGYTRERVRVMQQNITLTASPSDTYLDYASAGKGEIFNMTSLSDPSVIRSSEYDISTANQKYTQSVASMGDIRLDFSRNTGPGAEGFGVAAGAEYKVLDLSSDYTNVIYDTGADYSGYLYYPSYKFPKSNYALPFFDYKKFIAAGGWSNLAVDGDESSYESQASDFDYREKVGDAYVSLHYANPVVEAVLGLRYDDTRYVSHAPAIADDSISGMAKNTGSYKLPLPSFNLVAHVSDNTNLRLSLSRTIGRPTPSYIAQAESSSYDEDTGTTTISKGNPDLKPEKSFNIDASIERYFNDNNGYISLAWFRKNIQDTIFQMDTDSADASGAITTTEQYQNASKASIQGVELSFVNRGLAYWGQTFDLLFNATHMDGKMSYTNTDGSSRTVYQLTNQPKNVANLGVSWHMPWFRSTLTVAENYTGRYIIGFGSSSWQDRGFRGRFVTDASWTSRIDDHWSVVLTASNLFNKDQYETLGDNYQFMRNLNNYACTYYLHLKYDFN
ncbi:MAG: TonB-dependent receptor [Pseudoxanthomonas sp.]